MSDTQGRHPGSDRHSDQHAQEQRQHEDDEVGGVTVPTDFDVEEPTDAGDGEPVHRNTGGDIGEGAD